MKRIFLLAACVAALAGAASAQPTTFNPAATSNGKFATVQGVLNCSLNCTTKWNYAAGSGGIVDTTGVVLKAAAGTGKRVYVRSCQISNSGSGAGGTEILLDDGAAGTVLWRGWIGTLQERSITFAQPLQSSLNTLLEVKLSSSTNVAVRVNCQGYTD